MPRKKSVKRALAHQLKLVAIAVAMIPLCWLALIIYFVFFAPATTTAGSQLNWGNIIMMTALFGTLPGILLAGAVYTIVGIVYPGKH